jgi:hypothetical protein
MLLHFVMTRGDCVCVGYDINLMGLKRNGQRLVLCKAYIVLYVMLQVLAAGTDND